MKTFIYQNEEILNEVIATTKLMALESMEISYKPCCIKYEDVKGLNYRDTCQEIKPFTDTIDGTLFYRISPKGRITKLFLIG